MSPDSFNEDDSSFRQRLWGAAVLIAIAVIVLPLLLDGAGSESQFRRVEQLREEPPRIVERDGQITTLSVPEMRALDTPVNLAAELIDIRIGEDDPPDYLLAEREVRDSFRQGQQAESLTAWAVQAGSFEQEINALAVRDQLRRSGFASFIRDRDSPEDLYRVLVGPMIGEAVAEETRLDVMEILEREALVVTYP